MKKLEGLKIVYFEARHEKTMGDLIRLQGGEAIAAPALEEAPLENNPQAFLFAEKLFQGQIDVLVLLTGAGARALLETLKTRYPEETILEALRKIPIVPRGPKPIRVLNELNVPYALTVPEPNTWRELLESLDHFFGRTLRGKTIAVQEYGAPNQRFYSALKERGAEVFLAPVYRWTLPEDLAPLKNAIEQIISDKIHGVVFTTAAQAVHLFQVAGERQYLLRQALKKTVVASVGPDCSEAIRDLGVEVDIEPPSPKMGPLALAVADQTSEILKRKRSL